MKKLIAQLMKFGVVGVIAFIIDYGLLALLTEAFGVNYLVSATISFTVSVVFNYVASMRYVFTHKEGMSRRREFIIFVVLSVIGLGINNACMWAGVELPDHQDFRHRGGHGVELRHPQDLPGRRRWGAGTAGLKRSGASLDDATLIKAFVRQVNLSCRTSRFALAT